MGSILKRGGVRWAIDGDDLVIYVDADKLTATQYVDVPEVELVRIPNVRIAYGTGEVYDQYAARYHAAKVSLVRSAAQDVAQRV